jgi:hypothetical protein
MHVRACLLVALGGLICMSAGCLNVRMPEKVEVGTAQPEPVDSSRIPETATHEEARAELRKAYENIQYLEHENQRLHDKADKYKRERDQYKDRLKRYEKD